LKRKVSHWMRGGDMTRGNWPRGSREEGVCRGLHFAFMEFHRGRVNQKFEGVYKRRGAEERSSASGTEEVGFVWRV